jgi:hypothetical protein
MKGSPAGSRCRFDPGESWRFRPAFQVRRFATAGPEALRVPARISPTYGEPAEEDGAPVE